MVDSYDREIENTPFGDGLEEGFLEAKETLKEMLAEAEADEGAPEEYKRGFFLGYAGFYSEWLNDLQGPRSSQGQTLN